MHISPKLVDYLDLKLANNGMALDCIQRQDARGLMVEAAKACVGIREATGHNDGPLVELMQSTVSRPQGQSWCMSFVQSMAAYAAKKCKAVIALDESEHCLTVWQETPEKQRVRYIPLPGAVVIWQHGHSSDGHTGIIVSSDGVTMHTIEGNASGSTDPSGKVDRSGNGVYFNVRSVKGTGNMSVVGILKPFKIS